ncbi:hypothetical protein F441_20794, partial [Phytophthora nicotianae CJ01A1]
HPEKHSVWREQVDRYLRAKERHQYDFEARLNKAQEDHAGVIAKLKAKIAKLESVGPSSTFEEYKESFLKAKHGGSKTTN